MRRSVHVGSELPRVRGKCAHLQQVLLNLVTNAMDAMRETSSNRRVSVIARINAGRTVEIAVSDTGSGIPAEICASVFDPFFTTKPDGMGMGLAISCTVIDVHAGRLWVESNDGAGATFRFTLPTTEAA